MSNGNSISSLLMDNPDQANNVTSVEPEVTSSFADDNMDPLSRPAVKWAIVGVFVSVALVGVTANAIVLFTVTTSRRLRSVTGNVFVACLALSDLWQCAFSGPVQLHYQLTDRWAFGQVLCRVVFAMFAVPVYVSAQSILWIAIDRYRLIVHPLARRWTPGIAIGVVLASVVTSSIIAIPVVHYTMLYSFDDDIFDIHLSYCVERWPAASLRRAYSLLTFCLQFCLPLVATAALYVRIYARLRARRLHRRSTEISHRGTAFDECRHRHRRTSKKTNGGERTTHILIAIVTCFVACWLPWNVLSLIVEMDRSVVAGHNFKVLDICLKIFALIGSACINPIFYCWLNDGFRTELLGSLVNIRLRVLSSSIANGRVPANSRRRRTEVSGERHLSATERHVVADTTNGVTGLPLFQVRRPSSMIDDAAEQREVEFSHVIHSDQLTWCVLSNADYTSVTSYCRLNDVQLSEHV